MCDKAAVHMVPFAHLDLFWAGSREECLSRGAEIIETALGLLDRYPEYRFMIEAVNFLEYFVRSHPESFSSLKRHVLSGRLEVIPMRSIIYTHLPSGETQVRNYLYGREACEKWFGFSGKVATLSDIPGVTPQLPQITAKAGFTALFLSHGCPPHTDRVVYRALDGTPQRTYAPIHYGRVRRLFASAEDYGAMCANEARIEEELGGADYPQLCQFGTDLCVIPAMVVDNFRRWNAEGRRPFRFSTLTEYFETHFPETAKAVSGEIPSLWPNVESSWPDVWPLDLPAEYAMVLAEYFGAGRPDHYPREVMRQAWLWLLDAMDHNQNGIGGAVADREKVDLKNAARLTAERVARDLAMVAAAKTRAPRPDCFPMVVYNPVSWRREELVRARTAVYGAGTAKHPGLDKNNFRLIDDTGAEIPFRLVTHLARVADSIEVEFAARVPAFGSRAYFIEIAPKSVFPVPFTIDDGDDRDRMEPNGPAGKTTVENRFFRLEVDRVAGTVSLRDLSGGQAVFADAGLVAREEKRGDYICRMPLTGRAVPAVMETVEITERSAVACRVEIAGTVYGMHFRQTLTLPAEIPVLDIRNVIDWKCGHYVRIEQTFPFPDDRKRAIEYGVAFGKVRYPETLYKDGLSFRDIVTPERGADPDDEIGKIRLVSGWISYAGEGHAVTIASDHRMWRFYEQGVANCAIRGTGYCSGAVEVLEDDGLRAIKRPPDGRYASRYRIRPGAKPQTGWELNMPLYPVGVGRSTPGVNPEPPSFPSLVDTTDTGVLGVSVKPAEKIPGATVFRLFEAAGDAAEIALPDADGMEWFESDLLENTLRAAQRPLRFAPFEIKTVVMAPREKEDAT